MLYGSIRRNLYARLAIHKMRWTLVFDYLFTPISTPKWHESIWFCMKFYEFTISKNLVTMRFYGLLLRYIDLWKKANLQRFLISFLSISPLSVLILHFKISSYYNRAPFHKKAPIRMNYITSGFFCTPLVYVFPPDIKQGCRPVNLSADATALQKPQLSPKISF